MPFIKVEVYSIWKEWFLPFWRERNNWCETVSWAWLAHNLGTEGEKVFQTIPDPTTMFLQKSDKHIWPASKMFTGKEISIFNGLWHFVIGKSDENGLFLLLWSFRNKEWNNESWNYRNPCWSLAFCDGEKSGRFPFGNKKSSWSINSQPTTFRRQIKYKCKFVTTLTKKTYHI